MTTTPTAAIQPASLPDAPAAIFAVLGLIDIALLGVIGSSIAPARQPTSPHHRRRRPGSFRRSRLRRLLQQRSGLDHGHRRHRHRRDDRRHRPAAPTTPTAGGLTILTCTFAIDDSGDGRSSAITGLRIRVQCSPLITKKEPRITPASFDFWRANLKRDASSSGTSMPSESLKPTARCFSFVMPYITLIDKPDS
jgi:hypothetical protein